jgi:hypothetical protein
LLGVESAYRLEDHALGAARARQLGPRADVALSARVLPSDWSATSAALRLRMTGDVDVGRAAPSRNRRASVVVRGRRGRLRTVEEAAFVDHPQRRPAPRLPLGRLDGSGRAEPCARLPASNSVKTEPGCRDPCISSPRYGGLSYKRGRMREGIAVNANNARLGCRRGRR